MPYKDWSRQRDYQKAWKRARKAEFLGSARCYNCGSTEDLQLHHLDPEQKQSHRIWSWSRERILTELSKCVILCYECHLAVHHQGLELPIAAPVLFAEVNA